MSRRPTSTGKFIRNAFSLVGGILLEMVFIVWFMVLILGAASVALFLLQMVI